jgi:hypothetical protein
MRERGHEREVAIFTERRAFFTPKTLAAAYLAVGGEYPLTGGRS